MSKTIGKAALLLGAWAALSANVTLSPTEVELRPSEGETAQSLVISNRSGNVKRFEVIVEPRGDASLDGGLEIFPLQFALKPNSEQSLFVQYTAEQQLTESQSYLLNVQEIFVDADAGPESELLLQISLIVPVNVLPANVERSLSVEGNGTDCRAFILKNEGQRFRICR